MTLHTSKTEQLLTQLETLVSQEDWKVHNTDMVIDNFEYILKLARIAFLYRIESRKNLPNIDLILSDILRNFDVERS